MHLGCLAQYRAQAASPGDLLCPLCRHGRCPDCRPAAWSGADDAALRSLCQLHGAPFPERSAGESTVRAAIRDYALRTFTSNDAPEPRPPPGVTLLCCHRVAAVNGTAGVEFVPLPDREMQWAPVPIRHSAGIAAWRPSWVCPGCAEDVHLDSLAIPAEAGNPCNRCGAQLRWTLDRVAGSAGWSCAGGCAHPAADAITSAPAPPAAPHPPAQRTSPPRLPAWSTCGPPRDCSALATNSWLYVPLLHAAAGEMGPEGLQRWRSDPRASWWEDARHTSQPSVKRSSLPPMPQASRRRSASSKRQPPCHRRHRCISVGSCATSPNSRTDTSLPLPKRPASSFLAAALSHPTLIARLTPSAELLRLRPPLPTRVAAPLIGNPIRPTKLPAGRGGQPRRQR